MIVKFPWILGYIEWYYISHNDKVLRQMVHGINLLEFLINSSLRKFLVDMWCFQKKLPNLFPVNWCLRRNGEVWVCNRARAGFTTWSMIQVPVNSWVTVYSNCCCKGIWGFFWQSVYVSKISIEKLKCH